MRRKARRVGGSPSIILSRGGSQPALDPAVTPSMALSVRAFGASGNPRVASRNRGRNRLAERTIERAGERRFAQAAADAGADRFSGEVWQSSDFRAAGSKDFGS